MHAPCPGCARVLHRAPCPGRVLPKAHACSVSRTVHRVRGVPRAPRQAVCRAVPVPRGRSGRRGQGRVPGLIAAAARPREQSRAGVEEGVRPTGARSSGRPGGSGRHVRPRWDIRGSGPCPAGACGPPLPRAAPPRPAPPPPARRSPAPGRARGADDERAGPGEAGPRRGRAAAVLQHGGRPAPARRFPPRRDERLPGAADRHRGLQDLQDHRGGRPVGGQDLPHQPVLQGHLRQELQGHHRGGLRDGALRGAGRPLQPAAVSTGPLALAPTPAPASLTPAPVPSWDTAGQERFKCIASTYYRGAQAIVIVFDVNSVASLEHTRQWLADALKENDPTNVLLFLVGSKKDLSPPARYSLVEKDALKVAQEMRAEYWAVSSLTGENVREFFFRVAALTFESSVLAELERSSARKIGDVVRISSNDSDLYLSAQGKRPKCCR